MQFHWDSLIMRAYSGTRAGQCVLYYTLTAGFVIRLLHRTHQVVRMKAGLKFPWDASGRSGFGAVYGRSHLVQSKGYKGHKRHKTAMFSREGLRDHILSCETRGRVMTKPRCSS